MLFIKLIFGLCGQKITKIGAGQIMEYFAALEASWPAWELPFSIPRILHRSTAFTAQFQCHAFYFYVDVMLSDAMMELLNSLRFPNFIVGKK